MSTVKGFIELKAVEREEIRRKLILFLKKETFYSVNLIRIQLRGTGDKVNN